VTRRLFASFALCVLASRAAAAAPAPALEVALEPTAATVGDPIVATLTLRLPPADAALAPRFPDWTDGWGEAEVREAAPAARRAAADGAVWTQRLVLAAYRTGRVALPPVAVAVPREPPVGVATPADLAIEIRSVLPEDRADWQPAPPAPPAKLGVPTAFWIVAAGLAAAAAALAWRARRGAPEAVAPPLAPLAELERALATVDLGDAEAAHAALSLALRRYLGLAFSMPAAQASTSELGRRLSRRGLSADLVRRAVRLLREADQVKFARAPARREQAAARVAEARAVARAVADHLAPPAPEAAA